MPHGSPRSIARRKAKRATIQPVTIRESGARPSTESLMRHGDPTKRKRATQSGMRSGDGSGRLSAWTQPATLPFTLAVPSNDRRLDGRVVSTRRPGVIVTAY